MCGRAMRARSGCFGRTIPDRSFARIALRRARSVRRSARTVRSTAPTAWPIGRPPAVSGDAEPWPTMRARDAPGQVEITFRYSRHVGPRQVHGGLTLQFDSLRPYAFVSRCGGNPRRIRGVAPLRLERREPADQADQFGLALDAELRINLFDGIADR